MIRSPGRVLEEWLHFNGRTQAWLARESGLTPKHINHIVKDRSGIGVDAALALAAATGIPARAWLTYSIDYQLERRYQMAHPAQSNPDNIDADAHGRPVGEGSTSNKQSEGTQHNPKGSG